MIIGVPKEIKTKEARVALTPKTAKKLVDNGHTVLIEANAGYLSGYKDSDYIAAGAKIIPQAARVWKEANMVVKVKEPLDSEYQYFRSDLTLFTYLHLAGEPKLTEELCKSGILGIGYETVETDDHKLPLLIPMSEVAGRLGGQIGTYLLHKDHGGKGLLLGGVTGTRKGEVVIVGGGHVGLNAAEVAMGQGANVTVLDISENVLKKVKEKYGDKINTVVSTKESVAQWVAKADLLVGAVLVAGDKAPKVVSRELVETMSKGSVVVDVAIDQGGCIETIHATSHINPTYVECGVIHYAVPNMPALVPHTSTEALTTATEKYVLDLANKGIDAALEEDHVLRRGLQIKDGKVAYPVLAKLFPQFA
ncbi:alanine dehydrogenase [bacterium]|nr:alanine dehydrogenase [bacterium]